MIATRMRMSKNDDSKHREASLGALQLGEPARVRCLDAHKVR